ncbi:glutamate--tRNA ligase [Helicobacter salomonis]|nr:glutamate--tRNA ligase [Helicobacter salomonis]
MVVTHFAPSPMRHLHIGGLKTTLVSSVSVLRF